MKNKSKVIEFRFGKGEFQSKVVKDNLSHERASALADKLNAKQDKVESFECLISYKVA